MEDRPESGGALSGRNGTKKSSACSITRQRKRSGFHPLSTSAIAAPRWPSGTIDVPSTIALRSLCNISGLRTLLPLYDFELYLVALLQTLVTLCGDCAVVYENIWPVITPNEAVALCVVKPLNRTFQTFHVLPLGHVPLHFLRCAEAVPTKWCNCASGRGGCQAKGGALRS